MGRSEEIWRSGLAVVVALMASLMWRAAASLEHAHEDMNAHRLIDLRNHARLDVRAIEKQLEKVGNEIDAAWVPDCSSALHERAAPPTSRAAFCSPIRGCARNASRIDA